MADLIGAGIWTGVEEGSRPALRVRRSAALMGDLRRHTRAVHVLGG